MYTIDVALSCVSELVLCTNNMVYVSATGLLTLCTQTHRHTHTHTHAHTHTCTHTHTHTHTNPQVVPDGVG